MTFLNILDLLTEIFVVRSADNKTSKAAITFLILLPIEIVWFVVEMQSILHLVSPVLFLISFIIAGIIFSAAALILCNRVGWLNPVSRRDFAIIIISMSLFILCAANFTNRTFSEDGKGGLEFDIITVHQ